MKLQSNLTLTVIATLGAMEGELVPFMISAVNGALVGFVTDGSDGKGVAMGGLKKSSAFVGI